MKKPLMKLKILLLFIVMISSSVLYGQSVYKTPSGAKYHKADCRMVKNVSEKISLAAASKQGLTPCKICAPIDLSVIGPVKKIQGSSSTMQCKGLTKAGNRCLHKTSIGNGYCYQHQPGNQI